MSKENQAASPAPARETGDGQSGNITQAEATQKLLESYLPKTEATPEQATPAAVDVTPAQAADETAPSSTTEPPVTTDKPPETEAKAEVAEEPKEEDGVLSQDTTLTPEEREKFKLVAAQWQEGVNKRIGKE